MVTIPKPVNVDVSKLTFHPTNVKKHNSKQLHDLGILYEWIGFTDPIIADKNNVVWAGNGSLEEAIQKGMAQVPVVYMPEEWTEEQKKVFMMMDNKINESEYNKENIQILLEDVDAMAFEDFKMNIDDFIMQTDILEETNDIPEVPVEPKTQLGDIYELGNHRVMCGDSTKDLNKLLDGNTVDQLLTDPPYGVDYGSKNEFLNKADKGNRIQTPIKNDNIINYDSFFSNFLNIIPFSDYNTVYIFMGDTELNSLISALDTTGFTITSYLIWKKPQFVLGRKDYHSQHEIIIYGWKGKHKFFGGHNKATVFETEKKQVNDIHPTMKPIEILHQLVRDGSPDNGLVYDPFLGSGSTLIACEQTNRVCYGMELDPAYIDVIVERWENYTGKKAVLLSDLKVDN